GQWVRFPGSSHLTFLHGLEQRCLRIRRRPVDLVSQDKIAENWPRLKMELPARPLTGVNLRPGDVAWQHIRCKLDTAEIRLEVGGQCLYGTRLCKARQALQQQVTVGQESDQEEIYHCLLADDG